MKVLALVSIIVLTFVARPAAAQATGWPADASIVIRGCSDCGGDVARRVDGGDR
jgi:hypothetical protein